jgi:hypothetical protein
MILGVSCIMGRPPKPIEHHRRVGRANGTKKADGRPLPAVGEVVALPMAQGVPDPPGELLVDGLDLWKRLWTAGATWISPATDRDEVAEACRLTDDLASARERYRATRDPSDGRIVIQLSSQRSSVMGQLGFTPAARSKLGVAEVRRASALEELLSKRSQRS